MIVLRSLKSLLRTNQGQQPGQIQQGVLVATDFRCILQRAQQGLAVGTLFNPHARSRSVNACSRNCNQVLLCFR